MSVDLRKITSFDDLRRITPTAARYYTRYNIQWLAAAVASGIPLSYVAFWKADKDAENNIFSQWYQGVPFKINGREYYTAEQYMMSEKALLFGDLEMFQKIMHEADPKQCKAMGKQVKGFEQKKWSESFAEILFHGNLGKLQADIEFVDALMNTKNAVLIEASPLDDIYGAGMEKHNLLNADGSLKTPPQRWHKKDSMKQAENHLGFILMGIRDLIWELRGYDYRPGMEMRSKCDRGDIDNCYICENGIMVDKAFWKMIEGREPNDAEYYAICRWKNAVNVQGLLKMYPPKGNE